VLILDLFKKMALAPPSAPNPPPDDVPLDQTAMPGHAQGDVTSV
jgi:hypothetical protein